jgi:hypothetical protein
MERLLGSRFIARSKVDVFEWDRSINKIMCAYANTENYDRLMKEFKMTCAKRRSLYLLCPDNGPTLIAYDHKFTHS